ncbi:DUF1491 family protein [Blastomonas fulva]|jgi:hypothetical protein|uniref:DUF1491 domain-containing protein n=1 Tax=Blastomonas fulva TaxID=1550728 RepID=A0ABM6M570_9SPHN|nr:DUF1491 family protein [Blastomonas fulva]ASR51102.1 hypothetical protein B5J99_06140 [Blastomonas fulva]
MIEARLAAHIRIEALKRLTQAAGGFATLLSRGDPVAGAILIVRTVRGGDNGVLEGISALDSGIAWQEIWSEDEDTIAAKGTLTEYLARRRSRDPDIWVIELDVANRAQFDAILGQLG